MNDEVTQSDVLRSFNPLEQGAGLNHNAAPLSSRHADTAKEQESAKAKEPKEIKNPESDAPSKTLSNEEIKEAVSELNQRVARNLSFSTFDDGGRLGVIISDDTGREVRKFPSDETQRTLEKIRENIGAILDDNF